MPPAELHNRPEKIPAAVRDLSKSTGISTDVVRGVWGLWNGWRLDEVLAEYDVPRLPGAHCYEFYAGRQFAALSADEPASFYLTDFLTRHFERLVKEGLGLDRHPELMSTYFGNYQRLVYLSQSNRRNWKKRRAAMRSILGSNSSIATRASRRLA